MKDPGKANKEGLNQQPQLNMSGKKKEKKTYGKLLVAVIIMVIIFEYYCYVFETIWRNITPQNALINSFLLIVFHIILIFMLLAFYKTLTTLPGNIPLYWGFYIGDEDSKRKRYCLICNAFKPERAHHCSVCNVCILNMDHHCPWVNNCIGFYNRKFFMQLLFYVCLLTIYVSISAFYYNLIIILDLYHLKIGTIPEIIHKALCFISYGVIVAFTFIICNFTKFHIDLVRKNSTTIESLDKEHQQENEKYNVSLQENWAQVFGENKFFWFLPFDGENAKPKGDGLTWITKQERESDYPKMNSGNNFYSNKGNELNNFGSNLNYNSASAMVPNTLAPSIASSDLKKA